MKREGDRKTATIERASIVVSTIHPRLPSSRNHVWRICSWLCRQPGEGQLFTGAEMAAKDVDCVLFYDEEMGVRPFLCSDFPINNWNSFLVSIRTDLHSGEAGLSH